MKPKTSVTETSNTVSMCGLPAKLVQRCPSASDRLHNVHRATYLPLRPSDRLYQITLPDSSLWTPRTLLLGKNI